MEKLLDREQVKAAVADMQAAMDDMELSGLTKAISEERRKTGWGKHPVDIRLSIPLPFTRTYMVLTLGSDKRSKERIREDRRTHPLMRAGNLVVLALGLGLAVLAAIGAKSLISA